MAARQSITLWNVLALLAIAVGGGGVLLLDQLAIARWSATGKAYRIAQRQAVELPAGRSLVYYESPHSVPRDSVTLYLWDEIGERIFLKPLEEEVNYRVYLNGWSGRALWQLDLPKEGRYSFKCDNHNYPSDADIPSEDRVVFTKQPDSLEQLKVSRTTVQVAGGSVILVAAVLCYVQHGRTLRKSSTR